MSYVVLYPSAGCPFDTKGDVARPLSLGVPLPPASRTESSTLSPDGQGRAEEMGIVFGPVRGCRSRHSCQRGLADSDRGGIDFGSVRQMRLPPRHLRHPSPLLGRINVDRPRPGAGTGSSEEQSHPLGSRPMGMPFDKSLPTIVTCGALWG